MSDIMNGVDAVIGSIYMVLLVFVCAWFITNLALAVIYEQARGPLHRIRPLACRTPRRAPRPRRPQAPTCGSARAPSACTLRVDTRHPPHLARGP